MLRTTGRSRRGSHLTSAFVTTLTLALSTTLTPPRIERSRRCKSSAARSRSKVVEDDKNNISPRVGFAWDFRGDGRSVIRGGYGIYYDQSFLNVPLFAVQQANPEIYATFLNDGANLNIDSPPPSIPRPLNNPLSGTRGRMLDPDFESPYTQQWNFGYAQEIGSNMALEFDYVHILGLHEFTALDINPRIGPLINAQRSDPNPGTLLTSQFAAHAAELTPPSARRRRWVVSPSRNLTAVRVMTHSPWHSRNAIRTSIN